MCDVDLDDFRCEVWNETHPVARKTHQCSECRDPIVPGVRYDKITSLYEGLWTTTRVHPECHALTRYIAFDLCGQSLYFLDDPNTSLRYRVREHMGEHPEVLRMYRDMLRVRNREGRMAAGEGT